MYLHYGKVINCVQANTKYGPRLALNIKLDDGEKVCCWSDILDNQSFLSLKPNDKVRLIKSPNGSFTLVEDESNSNSNHNPNKVNTVSNSEEDILDLPSLSDADKRNIMSYIKSQSKLLKFCYDTVCQDFPTLEEYDPRGARSLAISLLISANSARDRYHK